MSKHWFVLAALSIAGGCVDDVGRDQDDDVAVAAMALVQTNGSSLNGTWLNGTYSRGTWLNGTLLDGASIGDVTLEDVTLDGSQLEAKWHGRSIAGADLVGAVLVGVGGDGSSIPLRIDAVGAPPAGSDVWSYVVSFDDGDEWQSICGTDDDGADVSAIAVAGRWDERAGVAGGGDKIVEPGVVTFACRGIGAIAKCVDMGYRPWASKDGQSLDAHHQACVRMVRADLCGDGSSYTNDGRTINVYDGISVQQRASGALLTWAFEAEWTPDGARCVSLDARDRFLDAGRIPPCLLSLSLFNLLSCGRSSHFENGTKVMNDVRATEVKLLGLL